MHDTRRPTVGSLFSGVGGLDLGLERAGFEVAWQCEADPYARQVLARHWPGVPCYPDVRALGCDVSRVDLLCGGFPCQPVSVAGKRRAQADPRWLWPAFADVVRRLRPHVVLVENVPGLRTAGLRDVLADLADLGFDAEWTLARASDFGAPHIRARLFLVATDADRAELRLESGWLSRAYRLFAAQPFEHGEDGHVADPDGERARLTPEAVPPRQPESRGGGANVADAECVAGCESGSRDADEGPRRRDARGSSECADDVADAERVRELQPQGRERDEWRRPSDGGWWRVEPDVGRVVDGISARMDCLGGVPIESVPPLTHGKASAGRSHRLRGLGNAVVPDIVEWLGREILRRWHMPVNVGAIASVPHDSSVPRVVVGSGEGLR